MTDDLDNLSELPADKWEDVRSTIIAKEISAAPTDKQKMLLELQSSLDEARASMSQSQYLRHLAFTIGENLQNLDDQLRYIKSLTST